MRKPKRRTARFAIAAVVAIAAPIGFIAIDTPAANASGCDVYEVIENAYVRENPSVDSVVRKTKYPGEHVRDCTGPRANPPGGSDWTPVECTCARDGIGYIVSRKLNWIGVD